MYRLFVVQNSVVSDALWEIDPDNSSGTETAIRNLPSGLSNAHSLTIHKGRLLAMDASGEDLWELGTSNSTDTMLRTVSPGYVLDIAGMTSHNDRLLMVNQIGNDLFEIDPDSSDNSEGMRLRVMPSVFGIPWAMTSHKGRLFIISGVSGNDDIWEIDPDGSDTEGMNLRTVPQSNTRSMTSYDDRLLIADATLGSEDLWEIDPDGSDTEGNELRDFPTALTSPFGMAAGFFSDVRAGSLTATKAYVGSTSVRRAYAGSTRVF